MPGSTCGSRDLRGLQKKALAEGIPYQMLVATILHKYVEGRLHEDPSYIRRDGLEELEQEKDSLQDELCERAMGVLPFAVIQARRAKGKI